MNEVDFFSSHNGMKWRRAEKSSLFQFYLPYGGPTIHKRQHTPGEREMACRSPGGRKATGPGRPGRVRRGAVHRLSAAAGAPSARARGVRLSGHGGLAREGCAAAGSAGLAAEAGRAAARVLRGAGSTETGARVAAAGRGRARRGPVRLGGPHAAWI